MERGDGDKLKKSGTCTMKQAETMKQIGLMMTTFFT